MFLKLVSKNSFLALQGDILLTRLDSGRDEVFVHTADHVVVASLGHALLVNASGGLSEGVLELLEARVDLEDGTFSLNFLLVEGPDLLLHVLKVNLFLVNSLVCVIVLFLNLRKLD